MPFPLHRPVKLFALDRYRTLFSRHRRVVVGPDQSAHPQALYLYSTSSILFFFSHLTLSFCVCCVWDYS